MDVKLAEWTPQSIVVKAALNYFGHVTRAKRVMRKGVMSGMANGNSKRRRPTRKASNNTDTYTRDEADLYRVYGAF